MRIVNRNEFLRLPSGIVYSDYKSHGMISGLYIKGDSWTNDWIYQDLLDSLECSGSNERADIIFEAEDNGGTFTMDLHCGSRDGLYETEQYFVVYDKNDLETTINRLTEVFNAYPSH